MVGDERRGFDQPDGLDADPDEDLLVGVGGEELPAEEGGGGCAVWGDQGAEDEGGGEEEGGEGG